MADSSVIKEFLVALGFQIDETSFKKFDDGIKNVEKGVEKLGLAVTALGVGVAAAVVKVGEQFEDLYYASERLHDSVENIQAFTFALGQVGGTGAGARAALESIEGFLRRYGTGGDAFFKNLGISTRDANGQLRGATDLMGDLATKFKAMAAEGPNGYVRANAFASVLGIDEMTLQAMIRGTGQFSQQYHYVARRMGIDQDASAKSMHNLMNQIRTLQMEGGLLFQKIALDLGTRLMPVLQSLEAWFEKNGSSVAERLEHAAIMAFNLALSFGRMAGQVIDWLIKLDGATGGWSTKLIELGLAMRFLGIGTLVGGLIKIATALPSIIAGIVEWTSATGGLASILASVGAFIAGPFLVPVLAIAAAVAFVGAAIWAFRDQIASAFTQGFDAVKGAFADVLEAFGELTGGTDGLLGILHKLADFVMWLGGLLIRFLGSEIVTAIAGGFRQLADDLHILADVIRAIADLLQGHWAKAWGDAKKLGSDTIHGLLDQLRQLRDMFTAPWKIGLDALKPDRPKTAAHHWWDWLSGKGGAPANDNSSAGQQDPAINTDFSDGSPRALSATMRTLNTTILALNDILQGGASGQGGVGGGGSSDGLLDRSPSYSVGGEPIGLRNNNPGNLRRWGGEPIVGGFAQFQTMTQGLSALAGNLLRYSRQGVDTVSAIISKWAPSKDHNDTAAYIRDVARELGVQAGQHLNLLDPETLSKLMAAIVRHENGRQPFNMDAMRAVASARLGVGSMAANVEHHHHHEKTISVNAPTTVSVSGAGQGPYQTAHDIAAAQSRVYGDLLRNTKSAVA